MIKNIDDRHYWIESENDSENFTVQLVTKENKQIKTITYDNVNEFCIYDGSAVIIIICHDNKTEYFRLKYLVRWTLTFQGEQNNESEN